MGHGIFPVGETDSPYKPFAHQRLQIEDQGDTRANHTDTVLRILRVLNKVKSADDAPLPPALVKRDAFGKEESAVSLRSLFDHFGERVRLPPLLEPTYLKEIVRLGIRSKEWVYYDEAANLAYDTDQDLADIVVDYQHMVMVPSEVKARGIPLYRKEPLKERGEKAENAVGTAQRKPISNLDLEKRSGESCSTFHAQNWKSSIRQRGWGKAMSTVGCRWNSKTANPSLP